MTEIVEMSRRNILYNIIIKSICKSALFCINCKNETGRWLRTINISSGKYRKIKQLHDKYKGERCFIICTGPSLTIDDLTLLKNEYTFGMNSICLLYDKTYFRPSFYGCIDEGVWLKLHDIILKHDNSSTTFFIGNRQTKHDKLRHNWYEIPINVAYHTYDRWFKGKFWCKFSDDAYKGVYDLYSVTHFLIQIAIYMGFSRIYLLGADCTFPKNGKIHFADYGVPDTTIDTAKERNICGYEKIKEYCDNHDVKIYNATRGGNLEIFERVNLENVL